ncbi:MAG: PKD domain-containing protein [Cytophagales bacterium]|nr:PKD domain-containing protein [Cytophagales bacterium]
MKKFYFSKVTFALLFASLLYFACDKTDPLPESKAGFEVQNADELERNIPVQFINQSTNAATFKWDFGDGNADSLNISPTHVYEQEGTYDVTLTAITQDGQTSTETKTIEIRKRVLVAFSVVNISFVDQDGNPWDDDGTGPDLIFVFGAQSADIEDLIFTDTTKNLTPADLPLEWSFSEGSGLELTNELHDLVLLDADPEKPEDPKYDVMFGIEMNPINYPFAVKGDDNSGLLQVSIGGFAIDLFVTFELQ